MGHPEVINHTPFELALLQLMDESGGAIFVPLVKATFDASADGGELILAEEQMPVSLSGEPWGKPGLSSYKYEPETAFCKPATDVALVGHAMAPRVGTTQMEVSFRVGALHKTLRVSGDRVWYKSLVGIASTPARRFERVPLNYEHAYGGWDRSAPDTVSHNCDGRNPVGRGFKAKGARFEDGSPLPNIEDPHHRSLEYGGNCEPAGVGFTSPDWQPRAALGGTYDAAWQAQRSPFLPTDFQRSFFNAASAGLIARGYLRGDEPVVAHGVSTASTALATRLPGLAAPSCRVQLRRRPAAELSMQLDTVILDADQLKLVLLWRALWPLPEGLQGVEAVTFSCSDAARFARSKEPTGVIIELTRKQSGAEQSGSGAP